MKTSQLLSFLGLFLLPLFGFSQDMIHLRSGEVIEGVVTRIDISTVTYKENESSRLEVTLAKNDIEEIILENGRKYEFEIDENETSLIPPSYSEQANKAIKFGLMSPLWGSFRVEYDQNLRPGRTIFASANIIGLGVDLYDVNPRGLGVSFGYKFMTSPDYYFNRMKRAHRLKGSYLMIEGAFSAFGRDIEYYDYNIDTWQIDRATTIGGALIVSYGKQFVMGEKVVLDYSVGVGYGIQSLQTGSDSSKDYDYYYYDYPSAYNFLGGIEEFPLVFKTRLSIGFTL